jgi:mitogen-activated protein kinase 1/3
MSSRYAFTLSHSFFYCFEDVDTDLYKLIMSPQYLTTEHIQMFLYQMLVAA